MLQLPSLQLYTANAFCSYFGRIYNFIKSYQSFLSVTDLDDVVSIQTFITKILKVFRLVSKNKIPGQKLDGINFNYHNHVSAIAHVFFARRFPDMTILIIFRF